MKTANTWPADRLLVHSLHLCCVDVKRRSEVLRDLAISLIDLQRDHPLRVAVDGITASGKTTLADELFAELTGQGRPVIRIRMDDFHHQREHRYRKGKTLHAVTTPTPTTSNRCTPRCSSRLAQRAACSTAGESSTSSWTHRSTNRRSLPHPTASSSQTAASCSATTATTGHRRLRQHQLPRSLAPRNHV
jgi:hypothetical protein